MMTAQEHMDQIEYFWLLCQAEAWDEAYSEGREDGFMDGYDAGYEDGKQDAGKPISLGGEL
jgi:flagellar biosynthesis/type III secretory pathway protein FliH